MKLLEARNLRASICQRRPSHIVRAWLPGNEAPHFLSFKRQVADCRLKEY